MEETGSAIRGESTESLRARLLTLLRERALERGTFTLASGKTSDYYIDVRRVVLDPEGLVVVAELLFRELRERGVVSVGGMAVGSVPIASAISMRSHGTDHPMASFFVRKEAKAHGTGGRIGGTIPTDAPVAIVEDTATTGGSSMAAVEQVRAAGGTVAVVIAVVDREEGAAALFGDAGVTFQALVTKTELLA